MAVRARKEVVWHDVSVDYDFSEGMPKNIEVKFLQDAWGGHGSEEDRNLIVDKIQVDDCPSSLKEILPNMKEPKAPPLMVKKECAERRLNLMSRTYSSHLKEHDVTKILRQRHHRADGCVCRPTNADQPSEDKDVAVRWPRIRHHKKIRPIKKLASLVVVS